ncbi:uncharacterized protein LOC118437806 [Folsomia candida]|nr:uncharacterized protein LOC118437806 [Folsomia candida]XP_035713089.1 uncharacterized protein LOC118437806 [Folsomia candida]
MSPGRMITEDDEILSEWTLEQLDTGAPERQIPVVASTQGQAKSANQQKLPGKPRSNVWENFDSVFDANGKPDRSSMSTCKKCGQKVSSQADRLNKHLSSCKALRQNKAGTSAQMPFLSDQMPESKGGAQSNLRKYFKSVNATEKNKLDFKLGSFIFASNLPFNVVSHPQFKEFVASLNPAYNIPSRETVRTTILDTHYQRVLELRKSEIEHKVGVLLQDGWSTNQNKPVLSHCLATPSGSYFLSAESTGAEKKDSETCFKYLQKAIDYCTESLNCSVVGIVTDNCSTMTAMQTLIRKDYPHMEVYGCNAHLFNLIGEKFTDKDLAEKIRHVQTYIRNHHFTSGRLDEMGGKRPVLPRTTRWNSQIDSFLNYLENHSKYLGIVRELCKDKDHRGKESFQKLKEVVEDNSVYNNVEDAVKLLQPICVALDEMQKEHSTLADAAEMWITLCCSLPRRITTNEYFLKQKKLGLTQTAIAAHILHPKYKVLGSRLTSEQRESGLSWISDKNPNFLVPAAALNEEASEFFYKQYQNDSISAQMTAISWWKAASKDSVRKEMLDMVMKLFALPASTGAIERNF